MIFGHKCYLGNECFKMPLKAGQCEIIYACQKDEEYKTFFRNSLGEILQLSTGKSPVLFLRQHFPCSSVKTLLFSNRNTAMD